jgi:hypothetical protein
MPQNQKRISITVCMLLVSIALGGCKAGEKSKQEQVGFENLLKSELGAKYNVSHNVTRTYALCQQEREGDHSRRKFKYIVIRLKDNKVIHRGSYSMGHVKWYDDQSIEVVNSSLREGDSDEKKIIRIHTDQL